MIPFDYIRPATQKAAMDAVGKTQKRNSLREEPTSWTS